jgi:GntR family transcriptional regulator, rspAB operon transcriptional repressor
MSVEFELPALEDESRKARQTTIGGRVYDSLRRAIVQLGFRPGNPLSEAEIGRQLGVSRQPVREAFIKLSEEGMLEIRPQRGTFVRLISIREVQNARFLREAIEVAIVRKASAEADAGHLAAIAATVEGQRAVAKSGDNVEFLRLDDAFHQTIARSADCDDAWRVLEHLKAQMDRVRYLSLPNATPLDIIIEQHVQILEALERRDAAGAEAAMRAHLSEVLTSLPKLAAAHPSFFAE